MTGSKKEGAPSYERTGLYMYVCHGTREVHNHVRYVCKCNRIVGECKCAAEDKEVVVFDECTHKKKKSTTEKKK